MLIVTQSNTQKIPVAVQSQIVYPKLEERIAKKHTGFRMRQIFDKDMISHIS